MYSFQAEPKSFLFKMTKRALKALDVKAEKSNLFGFAEDTIHCFSEVSV